MHNGTIIHLKGSRNHDSKVIQLVAVFSRMDIQTFQQSRSRTLRALKFDAQLYLQGDLMKISSYEIIL